MKHFNFCSIYLIFDLLLSESLSLELSLSESDCNTILLTVIFSLALGCINVRGFSIKFVLRLAICLNNSAISLLCWAKWLSIYLMTSLSFSASLCVYISCSIELLFEIKSLLVVCFRFGEIYELYALYSIYGGN